MNADRKDCSRVVSALRDSKLTPQHESHLFLCRSCRGEARLAAALKAMPAPEELEAAASIDETFVDGVLRHVHQDRQRRRRMRLGVAAAAALLFFFAAGVSERATATPTEDADESYAQILAPAADSVLPD
ncbi:MAG: hypothetical protein ABJC07_02520 [Acidobacteriota bacterium]